MTLQEAVALVRSTPWLRPMVAPLLQKAAVQMVREFADALEKLSPDKVLEAIERFLIPSDPPAPPPTPDPPPVPATGSAAA